MRFWVSGPRIGPFRPGVSFDPFAGGRRGRPQSRSEPRRSASFEDTAACVGGFVYIIERDGDHRIKIGSSINPPQRVASLQTGSADPLTIVYTHKVEGSAKAVELEAHEILHRQRGLGEWFDVPIDIAVGIINTASWRLAEEEKIAPQSGTVPLFSGATKAKLILFGAIVAALLIIICSPKKENSVAVPTTMGFNYSDHDILS